MDADTVMSASSVVASAETLRRRAATFCSITSSRGFPCSETWPESSDRQLRSVINGVERSCMAVAMAGSREMEVLSEMLHTVPCRPDSWKTGTRCMAKRPWALPSSKMVAGRMSESRAGTLSHIMAGNCSGRGTPFVRPGRNSFAAALNPVGQSEASVIRVGTRLDLRRARRLWTNDMVVSSHLSSKILPTMNGVLPIVYRKLS